MNRFLIKLAVFVAIATSSGFLTTAVNQDTQNEKLGVIDPKLKPREHEQDVKNPGSKELKSVEYQSKRYFQSRPRCHESCNESTEQNSENVERTHFRKIGKNGFHYRIFTGSSKNKAPAISENTRHLSQADIERQKTRGKGKLSDVISKAISKSRKKENHGAHGLSSRLVGSKAVSNDHERKVTHNLDNKDLDTTFSSTKNNTRKAQGVIISQLKSNLNERLDSRLLKNKGKSFAPHSKQVIKTTNTRTKEQLPSINYKNFYSIFRNGGSSSRTDHKLSRLEHPVSLQKIKNLNSNLNNDGKRQLKETGNTRLIGVLNPENSNDGVFTNSTRIQDKNENNIKKSKAVFIGDASKLSPGEGLPLEDQRQSKFSNRVPLDHSTGERFGQLLSNVAPSKKQSFDLQALRGIPSAGNAKRQTGIESVLFNGQIPNDQSEVFLEMEQDFVQNLLSEQSPFHDDFDLVYFGDGFSDSVLLSNDQFRVVDLDDLDLEHFSNPLPSSTSSFEAPNFDLGTFLYNNPILISGEIIDNFHLNGFGGDFSDEDLDSTRSRESDSSESQQSSESDSSESQETSESDSSESTENSSSEEFSSYEDSFQHLFGGLKETRREITYPKISYEVLGSGIPTPKFESSFVIQEAPNSFGPSSSIDYNGHFSDHDHLLGGLNLGELFHRDIQNGRRLYGFRRKKSVPVEAQKKDT